MNRDERGLTDRSTILTVGPHNYRPVTGPGPGALGIGALGVRIAAASPRTTGSMDWKAGTDSSYSTIRDAIGSTTPVLVLGSLPARGTRSSPFGVGDR